MAHENGPEEDRASKMERSYLEIIAGVPLGKNEDDENRHAERLEGEVVLMDKEQTAGKRWKWKNVSPHHEESMQRDSQML